VYGEFLVPDALRVGGRMVADGVLRAMDAKQEQFQISELATAIGTYPNAVVTRDDLHVMAVASPT